MIITNKTYVVDLPDEDTEKRLFYNKEDAMEWINSRYAVIVETEKTSTLELVEDLSSIPTETTYYCIINEHGKIIAEDLYTRDAVNIRLEREKVSYPNEKLSIYRCTKTVKMNSLIVNSDIVSGFYYEITSNGQVLFSQLWHKPTARYIAQQVRDIEENSIVKLVKIYYVECPEEYVKPGTIIVSKSDNSILVANITKIESITF